MHSQQPAALATPAPCCGQPTLPSRSAQPPPPGLQDPCTSLHHRLYANDTQPRGPHVEPGLLSQFLKSDPSWILGFSKAMLPASCEPPFFNDIITHLDTQKKIVEVLAPLDSSLSLTPRPRKVKSLSSVLLFATPWTVAYQDPPSMGFSRQEYWSGLPFPSPGNLHDPRD